MKFHFLRKFSDTSGFIEMEYLIAAAIGLVVMAAFATAISHMSNLQRMNDVSQDTVTLIGDLSNSMKTADFCTSSLNSVPVPDAGYETPLSMNYNLGGTTVSLTENSEIQPGLKIKKMRLLRNPAFTSWATVVTADGSYTQVPAILRVGTVKMNGTQELAMRDRDIPLTLTVDSSNKVKYCNTDSLAAQACYQSGGLYKPDANVAAGETHCMPLNHCDYGGTFSSDPTNGFVNPLTGHANCPAGYTAERTGTVSKITTKPKYADGISNSYYGISTCMRCGTTLVAQSAAVQDSIVDSTSMAAVLASMNTMDPYQSSTYSHITSTAQQAGSYVPPTPIPAAAVPPTPTPVPSSTPATPPPTATPTPSPSATPTDCAGWQNLYTSTYGSQCGGTLTCQGTDTVRENCGGTEWYTSHQNGSLTYHPGTCNCFAAGTKVRMADGSTRAIEKILAGEKIISLDESTRSLIVTTVVKPIAHKSKMNNMFDFVLANGHLIKVNDQHPMFVVEQGNYVESKEIASLVSMGVSVHLRDESGAAVAIVSVRPYREVLATYNLSVDGIFDGRLNGIQGLGHNYFVEGVLVHNIKAVCP